MKKKVTPTKSQAEYLIVAFGFVLISAVANFLRLVKLIK